MTTGVFIIARLSSTRLPAKNMMPILGKPMIHHLVERVAEAKTVDRIVITTSTLPSDDPLEILAKEIGVDCFRGDLDNIMERIVGAANYFNCDTVVEILGDNPLVHSSLIDDVVGLYHSKKSQYAATITKEYFPQGEGMSLFALGLRVQVYSTEVAEQYVKYPGYINSDRHPCAFIFDNPDIFDVTFLEARGKWGFMNRPVLNFAVNYQKNFDLVNRLYEKNYNSNRNFDLQTVFRQLDEDVELYQLFGAESTI